ncbi:Protein MTSS 1 [Manis javanica]|nr:Protein MTSS 1 [Manis javanica]
MARAGKLRCLRLIRNRCFFSCFTWHGKAQAAPSVCPLLADAGKMEAVIEKECSALGGLFQTIISDMKGSYPVWEDFINKAGKLQSQLRSFKKRQERDR